MNLQQLRYLCAVVDHGLNVSDAAAALRTSQPGISKQILQLEEELGIEVFVRRGRRLATLTPAGRIVVATARKALAEIGNMTRIADEYRNEDAGTLAIATTHMQARYVLPNVLRAFAQRYPKVRLVLRQGNPRQVAEHTIAGDTDLGIATEALADYPELVTLPCYDWNHCVVVPRAHPLAKHRGRLALETLAQHPIVTYDSSFTGRSRISAAFAARGIEPNVVLTALDADVIKTYVELGLGVGIISSMAFNPARDVGLRLLDCSRLFEKNIAWIAVRRGHYLRNFAYRFIELCNPELSEGIVRGVASLAGGSPAPAPVSGPGEVFEDGGGI